MGKKIITFIIVPVNGGCVYQEQYAISGEPGRPALSEPVVFEEYADHCNACAKTLASSEWDLAIHVALDSECRNARVNNFTKQTVDDDADPREVWSRLNDKEQAMMKEVQAHGLKSFPEEEKKFTSEEICSAVKVKVDGEWEDVLPEEDEESDVDAMLNEVFPSTQVQTDDAGRQWLVDQSPVEDPADADDFEENFCRFFCGGCGPEDPVPEEEEADGTSSWDQKDPGAGSAIADLIEPVFPPVEGDNSRADERVEMPFVGDVSLKEGVNFFNGLTTGLLQRDDISPEYRAEVTSMAATINDLYNQTKE